MGERFAQPLSSIMAVLRADNDRAAGIAFTFGFVPAAAFLAAIALMQQDSAGT